jgi:hypothetical protein
MKKLLSITLCIGALFLISLAVRHPVYAADTTVTYQGVLIKNPNTTYTHKLQNQNVNFILNSSYNKFEGQKVVVTVNFAAGTNKFSVTSMKLVSNNQNASSTTTASTTPTQTENQDGTVTYTGVLQKNINPNYTDRIVFPWGQVNLILAPKFQAWEGQVVSVTVLFDEGANTFHATLIKLI